MDSLTDPRRRQLLATAAVVLASGDNTARAAAREPLRVGRGEAFGRIADAIAAAVDGDTIEVLAGDYEGDVSVVAGRRLRLRGIAGLSGLRPVVHAAGRHAEGKAIWVLREADVEIDNFGFSGTRVPDGNGAGIRLESGRLRVARSVFVDNQTGILTGNRADTAIDVEGCEFAQAAYAPGLLPHLLYVGLVGHCRVAGSRFHHGHTGHLLKCRARVSVITDNQLDDGADGRASYEIDLPNGGDAQVVGNVIGQGTASENAVLVAYGAEADRHAPWPVNRLELRNNTLLNRMGAAGVFVRAWPQRLAVGTEVVCTGNRLLGGGSLELGPGAVEAGNTFGPLPR